MRTPPFNSIEQTRENIKSFIRLSVVQHLRSDTFRGRLCMAGTPFKGIKKEFAETVVIKYAGTELAIKRLEHEYQVLQKLKSASVTAVPKIIGLFFYQTMEKDDDPQSMAALVMEDAGAPVDASTLSSNHMYVSNTC